MSEALSIGRFAPSPSGPLHFGSLLAAVASFMQAKHHGGKWLVRIEDIDPPREVVGASDTILRQLELHGLHWDDSVIFQSAQNQYFLEILDRLRRKSVIYNCDCTRQRLNTLNGIYDNHCRNLDLMDKNTAIRLSIDDCLNLISYDDDRLNFIDQIMGSYSQSLNTEVGDFVLRRRDSLISYQLAVVIDDHQRGITEIVRGADLIDSTPRQILLQKILGYKTPTYAHIPLAINSLGQKLSKQHHAKELPQNNESEQVWLALSWLDQTPPLDLRKSSVSEIIDWGIANWDITKIPDRREGFRAPDNFL